MKQRAQTHTDDLEKKTMSSLIFRLLLLCCSGDKEAEGVLSEVGDGGAWRH